LTALNNDVEAVHRIGYEVAGEYHRMDHGEAVVAYHHIFHEAEVEYRHSVACEVAVNNHDRRRLHRILPLVGHVVEEDNRVVVGNLLLVVVDRNDRKDHAVEEVHNGHMDRAEEVAHIDNPLVVDHSLRDPEDQDQNDHSLEVHDNGLV
jgi:hypothetical protein